MSITALTLTNPGAESASTTGWTTRSGSGMSSSTGSLGVTPHTGSRFFLHTSSTTVKFDQTVDVSAHSTAIDSSTAAAKATVYYRTLGSTDQANSSIYLECYAADGTTLLGDSAATPAHPTTYTQQTVYCALPSGTRSIRIGVTGTSVKGLAFAAWDDFTLDFSDDKSADYSDQHFAPITTQVVAYGLVSEPTAYIAVNDVPVLSVEASETSSGLYKVFGHQFVGYALVKKHGDKRKLRAWTFPQDDHKFYVLQLGNSNGTLIYDQLTQQWARWQSPSEVFWRGEDGCDWEGFNVACDPLTGKIFKIDPEGRLDYNDTTDTEDTPITSIVVGGTTERFRKNVPCYMAELAISEGQPPEGIDATTVSISLRSNDTLTTYDHGSVLGTTTGDRVTVRWYGLGLMGSPGRVFEITDTGYARRIDGLNIEVGGQGGPQ